MNNDARKTELASALPARRRWQGMARFLVRSPLVRRLVRRLIWSERTLDLLAETGDTLAVRQARWANALDRGSTFPLFVPTSNEMAPENFAEHMKRCRCVPWRWFLECGIDEEIKTVLDVGCGTGYRSHHFVNHGYDVTGVTSNPYEKDECVRRGMKIIEEDFHFLTIPRDSFDLVFSSHSIEHSVSPLFALWEWKRIVRPGDRKSVV
jgi:SAM-dependent methyltransferase